MSDGYSPNWSPGDPLEDDETISDAEKKRIADESDFTPEEEAEYWAEDEAAQA